MGHLLECFDILVGDEVIDRIDVTTSDRIGHHRGRLGFSLGEAFARLGFTVGGLAFALGLKDGRLLFAVGLENCSLAETFRLQNVGAFLALGFHLARHRIDEVARR